MYETMVILQLSVWQLPSTCRCPLKTEYTDVSQRKSQHDSDNLALEYSLNIDLFQFIVCNCNWNCFIG